MISKLVTFWKLGLHNLVWVIIYRLALKLGMVTRNMKIGTGIKGPFFSIPSIQKDTTLDSINPKIFGWYNYSKVNSPQWELSFISGKKAKSQNLHWSKISDFSLDIGDIKPVWDLSRFDWLFYFTVEFLKTEDEKYIDAINSWLEDWTNKNPVNLGLNWKCGQEASIRVMHLCVTAFLLKQHGNISPSLIEVLEQHLARISPTVLYAMAQDNNHGTSEAVALYIGGIFLEANTNNGQASKWKKQGRFWLENRVNRLIMKNGSFSQYSVNYHRVMLDSLSLAEFFRLQFSECKFSVKVSEKIRNAIDWLRFFTDETNGDAPNLGPNDGARLIPLSNTDYRDYRPSIQFASVLFNGKKAYDTSGCFNQHLKLFSLIDKGTLSMHPPFKDFDDGGYLFLSNKLTRLYMRYPKFKFRPSHCDIFHVDFWLKGINILRDAGSYSYNTDKRWLEYFPSTKAHNTIQFDDREQMPRLSRFLLGNWLKTKKSSGVYRRGDANVFKADYQDEQNVSHSREVALTDAELTVVDEICGFKDKAVLRWRLTEGNYHLKGTSLIADNFKIIINSGVKIERIELVEGWESLHYLKKNKLQVLEVEVHKPSQIRSKITWDK